MTTMNISAFELKFNSPAATGQEENKMKIITKGDLIENQGLDLNGSAFVRVLRKKSIYIGGLSRYPRVPGAQTGRNGEHPSIGYWVARKRFTFVKTLAVDGRSFNVWRIEPNFDLEEFEKQFRPEPVPPGTQNRNKIWRDRCAEAQSRACLPENVARRLELIALGCGQ